MAESLLNNITKLNVISLILYANIHGQFLEGQVLPLVVDLPSPDDQKAAQKAGTKALQFKEEFKSIQQALSQVLFCSNHHWIALYSSLKGGKRKNDIQK